MLPKLQLDTGPLQPDRWRKSQLETAQAELDRNEVKAPFDGVIDRVPVELGSAVMAGRRGGDAHQPRSRCWPVGEVSERDLAISSSATRPDVRLVNGQTVKGTVRYISRDASSATRTFRVEVAIPNPRTRRCRPA